MSAKTAMAEATRLHRSWRDALDAYRRCDTDANYDAEQDAYNVLIDHIEANGLNYADCDPRGAVA